MLVLAVGWSLFLVEMTYAASCIPMYLWTDFFVVLSTNYASLSVSLLSICLASLPGASLHVLSFVIHVQLWSYNCLTNKVVKQTHLHIYSLLSKLSSLPHAISFDSMESKALQLQSHDTKFQSWWDWWDVQTFQSPLCPSLSASSSFSWANSYCWFWWHQLVFRFTFIGSFNHKWWLYFIPDMTLHQIQCPHAASSIDSAQQYSQSSFSQFHAKWEIADLQWEIIHLQCCNTELEQTNGHLEQSNIKLEAQYSTFQWDSCSNLTLEGNWYRLYRLPYDILLDRIRTSNSLTFHSLACSDFPQVNFWTRKEWVEYVAAKEDITTLK